MLRLNKTNTQNETSFKLSELAKSKELEELRSYIGRKDAQHRILRRMDVMKSVLAHWVLECIEKNPDDGITMLNCLSVANQVIKDIYNESSNIIHTICTKDPRDNSFMSVEMQNSCKTVASLHDINCIYKNFTSLLNQKLELEKNQQKSPSLSIIKKNLTTQDKLSKKMASLYAIIAATQDLTQKEVNEVKHDAPTPLRSPTPIVPQTPTTRTPNELQTSREFIELEKYFSKKHFKMSSTTSIANPSIKKREVFKYVIANWVIRFIRNEKAPMDPTRIQTMLRIAFEASEETKDKNACKTILTSLNDSLQRTDKKALGSNQDDIAHLGDMHILLTHYPTLLQNKFNERLKKKEVVIDSSKGKTHLSGLLSKLQDASNSLQPQNSVLAISVNENESKSSHLAVSSSSPSVAPLSPQGLPKTTITALAEFQRLDDLLIRMSRKMQTNETAITQIDILNYLTIYWLINFVQQKNYPKGQDSLLKMVGIALQAIKDISQADTRTAILAQFNLPKTSIDIATPGGFENRAVRLHEMHTLIHSYPGILTTRWSQAQKVEKEIDETLKPISEMNQAEMPAQYRLTKCIAELGSAIKKMEFKEAPAQPLSASLNIDVTAQATQHIQRPTTPRPVFTRAPAKSAEPVVNEAKMPAAMLNPIRRPPPPPPAPVPAPAPASTTTVAASLNPNIFLPAPKAIQPQSAADPSPTIPIGKRPPPPPPPRT